jgi:hypothetical protein
MVWYGLASKNGCAGSAIEAIEKLNGFWDAFAETNVAEKMLNFVAYSAFKAREVETPVLGLNAPVFSLDPRGAISQAIYRRAAAAGGTQAILRSRGVAA